MHQMPTPEDTPKVGAASTASSQRKPRKPRGRGLRTTTGCAICRKRHMKCDEVKPTCGPCAKGKRECVYGAAAVAAAKSPPSATGSASDTETKARPQLHQNNWQQRPLTLQPIHAQTTPITTTSSLPADIKYTPASVSSSFTNQSWDPHDQHRSPGSEPDLAQLPWNQTYQGSQTSTPLSTLGAPDPFRWFGMLAEDGPLEGEGPYSARPADLAQFYQQSAHSSPSGRMAVSDVQGYPTPQMQQLTSPNMLAPSLVQFPTSSTLMPEGDERELWQAPITLTDNEICLFHTFVDRLSLWLDLFDPLKHFSTLVPQLALSNEGLMKAILALSARHLSLNKQGGCAVRPQDRTIAVQYYSETLQYLQRAMKFESYTRSPDIIATSLIVSAYEMIDGAGKSWERHLKGVFWIQRSQDNDGESGGLRQAVWWAWLRQDVWAAFRERRRCFSFWKPKKPYCRMDQYEIALRVVYILSQAVNYASDEERRAGEMNVQARAERADYLLGLLDDWKRHLTVHFQTLPVKDAKGSVFKPIWINPSAFGVAIQMYHFARILLLVHGPVRGSYPDNRSALIAESVDIIGGIAMTISDPAATIVSIQALYCAGQYTGDVNKQSAIAQMIDQHQERTGWPVIPLTDELRAEWTASGPFIFPTPPDEVDMKYFDTPMSMPVSMEGITSVAGMC